jgi:hypothetical protein
MSEENTVIEDDDEFDSAFAEFTNGKEPEEYLEEELEETPYNDPEDPEEEPVNETVEPEQVADPFADLDDAQRDEIGRLRKEAVDWKHRYQSDEGRVSALQRKINELENRATSTPTVEQIAEVADSGNEEEMNAFKEDYPDIALAVDRMVASRLKAERQQHQQVISQMDSRYQQILQPIQQQEHQRTVDVQLSSLEQRHSDWREVATSASFTDWVSRQPEAVRNMVNSDYADDASYVLDSFKSMSGHNSQQQTQPSPGVEQIVNKRQQVLDNAVAPRTRRSAPKTGVPDDFDAAFAYYANK